MKYLIVFLTLVQIFVIREDLTSHAQEHGGYGYGGPWQEEEEWVEEEEEMSEADLKKVIGKALAIVLPIVLGVVGGKVVKNLVFGIPIKPFEDIKKPFKFLIRGPFGPFGILGPLSPLRPRPLLPFPFGRSLPDSPFPVGGNLGVVKRSVNKRSIDNSHKKCGGYMKSHILNAMLLLDTNTQCIPKIFCSVMAEQQNEEKPNGIIEEEVYQFLYSYTQGDTKRLLEMANDNTLMYGSALGQLTHNVTMCKKVFSQCPYDAKEFVQLTNLLQ